MVPGVSVVGSPLAALGGVWLGSGLQERSEERKRKREESERVAERRRASTVVVLEHLGTVHRIAEQAFEPNLIAVTWTPLDSKRQRAVAVELSPALVKGIWGVRVPSRHHRPPDGRVRRSRFRLGE